MALDVGTLRELFRNLEGFRSVYETEGVDVLIGPDGEEWCLWDLEHLYLQLPQLPPRQYQAIELCLVANVKESDAAVMMGVSPTNPVAMYATAGLNNLIALIENGTVSMQRPTPTPCSRTVPARGRTYCRSCGESFSYEGPQELAVTVEQMKAHTCEEVARGSVA